MVINELFSLGVTEALRANIYLIIGVFAPRGSVWPKISARSGRPLTTILLVEKLR